MMWVNRIFTIKEYRATLLQLIVFLVVLGILAWFFKSLSFKSMLLGGAAWFIPAVYFLWRMRSAHAVVDNKTMLKRFFITEITKLSLSFGLIIFMLLVFTIDSKSFLSGFIVMILVMFQRNFMKTQRVG